MHVKDAREEEGLQLSRGLALSVAPCRCVRALKTHVRKNCCSFSLQKLMHSCSKEWEGEGLGLGLGLELGCGVGRVGGRGRAPARRS